MTTLAVVGSGAWGTALASRGRTITGAGGIVGVTLETTAGSLYPLPEGLVSGVKPSVVLGGTPNWSR